jgi:hypothetical protein
MSEVDIPPEYNEELMQYKFEAAYKVSPSPEEHINPAA